MAGVENRVVAVTGICEYFNIYLDYIRRMQVRAAQNVMAGPGLCPAVLEIPDLSGRCAARQKPRHLFGR